jgi:hypothetical protein
MQHDHAERGALAKHGNQRAGVAVNDPFPHLHVTLTLRSWLHLPPRIKKEKAWQDDSADDSSSTCMWSPRVASHLFLLLFPI